MDAETITDISQLPPKQAAFAILRENGMKTQDAAKVIGYKPFSAYNVESKLKRLKLSEPKIVKDAHKVIKNILQGKTWGDVTQIKDSSALMAANMVYDRFDPKVTQNLNINLNADISPIDLEQWRSR
jgi:hypothetical protein